MPQRPFNHVSRCLCVLSNGLKISLALTISLRPFSRTMPSLQQSYSPAVQSLSHKPSSRMFLLSFSRLESLRFQSPSFPQNTNTTGRSCVHLIIPDPLSPILNTHPLHDVSLHPRDLLPLPLPPLHKNLPLRILRPRRAALRQRTPRNIRPAGEPALLPGLVAEFAAVHASAVGGDRGEGAGWEAAAISEVSEGIQVYEVREGPGGGRIVSGGDGRGEDWLSCPVDLL